jgi:uncharacterized protein (TIGR03066 family)
MRKFSAFALVVFMCVAVRSAAADDDNAKKIVGTWEVTKGAELSLGDVVEFTKDGKVIATVVVNKKEVKVEGTYKVEKDKLITKTVTNGKEIEDIDEIVKLTDDAMELRDKDKKVTTFKKKK